MNHSNLPKILLSVPIDTSHLELRHRRASFEDMSRATSPSDSTMGIYIRSRPSTPAPEGESYRMSLILEQYPDFDYTDFTPEILQKIKQKEGRQALSLGVLPPGFSASTTTLATSDGDQGENSDDTLSVGSFIEDNYKHMKAASPAAFRVRVVAQDDNHGQPLARAKDSSDTKSIAPSVRSNASRLTITPLRAVRRALSSQPKEDTIALEVSPTSTNSKPKPKGLPSVYKSFKNGILNVIHGKSGSLNSNISGTSGPYSVNYVFDPPVVDIYHIPVRTITNPVAEYPQKTEQIKSSSSSVFSMKLRRRTTIDSQKSSNHATSSSSIKRALSIRSTRHSKPTNFAMPCARANESSPVSTGGIRRSRSFSGYADINLGPGHGAEEIDKEFDEVTAEAALVATRVRGIWDFRPVGVATAVEDGFLFERNVEVASRWH